MLVQPDLGNDIDFALEDSGRETLSEDAFLLHHFAQTFDSEGVVEQCWTAVEQMICHDESYPRRTSTLSILTVPSCTRT